MEDLISVIVPVYKAEPYIKKCIESILSQTYGNLEIILVDDGSPDKCPQICDEYAEKDSHIKVIHKENGGLSNARNAGLDCAAGHYIGFVDADDWIEPEMYEVLYHAIVEYSADMSAVSFTTCPEPVEQQFVEKNEVFDQISAILEMHKAKKYAGHAVTKLYRSSLFETVRFPEDIFLCEDLAAMALILDQCNKVAYSPYTGYHYIQRDSSIVHRRVEEKDWTVLQACQMLWDQLYRLSPKDICYADLTFVEQMVTFAMRLNAAGQLDKSNFKSIKQIIRKHDTEKVRALLDKGVLVRLNAFLMGKQVFTITNYLLRFRLNRFGAP